MNTESYKPTVQKNVETASCESTRILPYSLRHIFLSQHSINTEKISHLLAASNSLIQHNQLEISSLKSVSSSFRPRFRHPANFFIKVSNQLYLLKNARSDLYILQFISSASSKISIVCQLTSKTGIGIHKLQI